MDTLTSYLKRKQERGQSEKPRYGMRKLSVGFVSCFLGCAIFMAPVGVHAEEATDTPVAAVETKAEVEKPVENAEVSAVENEPAAVEEKETVVEEKPVAEVQNVPAEEKNVSEEAPEAATLTNEEESDEADKVADTSETKSEEKQDNAVIQEAEPDDAQTDETETADKDLEAESEEKPQADKAKESEAEAVDATKLDVSEEVNPEAQQAGETEEDAITNVEIKIGGAKNGEKTEIVNPTALPERTNGGNTDINLEAQVDFDIPKGTKAGRTFDFEVSDNVNLHGILVDEDKAVPVKYDGVEIATGTKLTDGRRGYRYTFNENVDGLEDIRVRILYPLWIDPDKVPLNSEKETVTVKVAGVEASEDYKIEYENVVSEDKLGSTTLSGIANIEEVTSDSYEHVIYVNPRGDQGLINSNITIENDVDHDSATFDEDVKNSVEVYKVKDSDKLPLSFGINLEDGNYEKVENAEVKLVADGNKNKLVVNVNQGDDKNYFKDDAYDKSAYIIKYKGKRTPEKETKTKITYKADRRLLNGKKESLVTDGRFAWTWTNEIVFDDADAIALANKTYTLGDKVWIDADEDGSQGDSEVGLEGVKVILKGINMSDRETTTDANGNYKFEKLRNGEYTVEFEIPTGYAPTKAKAEGSTEDKDSDACQAKGTKVAIATGIINGANNMNVDFGVIKSEAPVEEKTYTLGDRVWIDDNKDGIQTDGEKGVEGVTVKLTGGDLTEAKTTTTDANGEYKFEGLKNGEYKVTFEIPEKYEATKTDQGDDDAKDSDGAEVTVTIKDANNDTVDLGLVKKEAPVTEPDEPIDDNPKDPTPGNPTPNTPDEPTGWTPLKPVDPKTSDTPVKEEPKNPEPQTPEEPAQPEQPAEPKPADEEVEKPAETKVEDEESLGATDPADREEEINQPKNYKENEEDLEGKAPQTFDAGVAPYTGLAGLASSVFAYLESKKRRNK